MGRSVRQSSGEVTIEFQKFHAAQKQMYKTRTKREAWRCGRRFGKTTLLENANGNWAVNGLKCGWFAPDYKLLLPTYKRIHTLVAPFIKASSKVDMIIELQNGGLIEFWTLNNPDAGRSRAYHKVTIDEAGLVKTGLKETWDLAIEPTLLDYSGDAIMCGTPKGEDPENFFYEACTDKALGWREVHAPSHANPLLPVAELERLEKTKPPLVWRQEYRAEFVNWNGAQFFELSKILGDDGYPVPMPVKIDAVYAVIDTALKSGQEHDGTAVVFVGISKYHSAPLTILDWDIVQIDGGLLESWLPTVYQRLEVLAAATEARNGSIGVFIEDKGSGTVLLQQAERHGWMAEPIDTKLTAMGKDERALSVSGYWYNGQIKICVPAYEKVKEFKQQTRNHLLTQVLGFRIGDKDAHKRADDLFDVTVYSISIGLGDQDGW